MCFFKSEGRNTRAHGTGSAEWTPSLLLLLRIVVVVMVVVRSTGRSDDAWDPCPLNRHYLKPTRQKQSST